MPKLRTDAKKIGISSVLILIPMILVPLVLAADKPAETPKPQTVVIAATKDELSSQDIYIGQWAEKILDPRCINFDALIRATSCYKQIEEKRIPPGTGKYWILMSMASDTVKYAVSDYAKENKVAFVCKRSVLFKLLRKLPEFKDKPDSELNQRFDITAQVADFALKKNQEEGQKEKK